MIYGVLNSMKLHFLGSLKVSFQTPHPVLQHFHVEGFTVENWVELGV